MNLKKISEFAKKAHDDTNCMYDGKSYYTHIQMVEDGVDKYSFIFKKHDDFLITRAGASCHDLIEDARLTFNDIRNVTNEEVAKIVLDVTDVHEENRLLRHLHTMGKTVKDYRAIILKLCDIRANGLYSKRSGSSMHKKYVMEYEYRKPIFKMALKWYSEYLKEEVLNSLWKELDEIHEV